MIRAIERMEALAELKDMVAWDSHPVLTEPQLLRLLDGAARIDANRRAPDHEDWATTYDLAAAAVEGWNRKAAKVAGDFNFTDAESRLERGQVLQHCRQMAAEYSKQITPFPTKFNRQRRNTPSEEFEQLIWDESLEI